MADYGTLSRISGEIGEIKGQLGELVGSFRGSREQDRQRCETILERLERIGDELERHDSKSDHHVGSVDSVSVELNSKLRSIEDLLTKLVDRKMFWQPVLQTFLKSLVPTGLGAGTLALLAYVLSHLVELGAALTGWLR